MALTIEELAEIGRADEEIEKSFRRRNAEYQRQYRIRNQIKKAKELERQKKYRQANKLKIAMQQKKYRQENKDKITEQKKAHYEANKAKILEYKKKYYETNKIVKRNGKRRAVSL